MGRTFAQLPGYETLARIGRGAGAVLYEARHLDSRRIVAIKHVVRHGPEDDRFLEQAEIEYEIGHKLDHPALRRILEIHRVRRWLKTSELFLVMEFVDGIRMEDQPPAEIDRMLAIFIDTAEGLAAMHKAGYVHADIKPNNIMLCKDGSIRIIDFGQSCELGHRKARIQGTPDYMAPEQALRHPIDQRTDIFNLGATMYWVTTGKWFKTMMNVGTMGQKKIEVDARSTTEPPHEVNPRIPLTLSQLVMDCCEQMKEQRPRDMKTVSGRLEMIRHLLQKKTAQPGT